MLRSDSVTSFFSSSTVVDMFSRYARILWSPPFQPEAGSLHWKQKVEVTYDRFEKYCNRQTQDTSLTGHLQ
jgi:hypothetical protein